MARRQRVDSIAAAKVIAAASVKTIEPPAHITLADADRPFWESVIAEFPKADWTAHQLEVAAQLAKAMTRLEREGNALDVEGYVIEGRANPRHGVVRDLTNSIMSLRRNLQLHARAQGGEARDVAKRKAQAKAVESNLNAGADDDFIARPTLN